jgi:hypothetical protein
MPFPSMIVKSDKELKIKLKNSVFLKDHPSTFILEKKLSEKMRNKGNK